MTVKFRHFAFTAALAACAFGGASGAAAQGMESAQAFWRNQTQPSAPAATPEPYGGYGNDGGDALGYAGPTPFGQYGDQYGGDRRAPRATPHVSVKSPQYYDYRPDALADVDFAGACKPQVAANTAPSETTGAAPVEITGAVPIAPATLTPDDSFAQACAQSPAISLRVLPEVGKAIAAYYAAHPHFIWVKQGRVSGKAIATAAELQASDRYGLAPADYRVALPATGLSGPARHQALLRYEFTLSAKALTYVLDARRGRVAPDRISGYHDLPRKQVDLVAALGEMAQTGDVGEYLKQQNPDNGRFRALVAALQKLRADAEQPHVSIDADTKIKPGEENPALAKVIAAIGSEGSASLKAKHAAELAQAPTAQKYTPDLVALVRDFQKERGLSPDGVIGANTVQALSGNAPSDKIEKVVLAMERLRWLPRQFGARYVFLNEPAFTVNYIDGNKVAFSTKAVIGQVSKQTFFFTDRITAVEYNPYWNVPRSILVNEMLPHLYRDPSYLDRHGYQVTNERGRRVSSAAVSWSAVASNRSSVDVRQPPGNRNALGRLKIEFPNPHAVYMHDTPEKNLFAQPRRAFSHGCVRLQQPRAMAAALLGAKRDYIDQKIARGENASERVPGDIPVYLAYFTAWPDLNGEVHYYADVYGRDDHLSTALKKTEAARAKS